MSKRAPQFERAERDFYPTPAAAVVPLLAHLSPGTRFIEPCAGAGDLARELVLAGHTCTGCFDIEPRTGGFNCHPGNAMFWTIGGSWPMSDAFITNPPWAREVLHPIIVNLATQLPTWLLFDADWMHTAQAQLVWPLLRRIVSVGRVQWIPGSGMTGKDNCCWYLFDAKGEGTPAFYPKWERV